MVMEAAGKVSSMHSPVLFAMKEMVARLAAGCIADAMLIASKPDLILDP